MGKLALLFAGQGAQHPAMGLSVLAEQPALKRYYDDARSILGFSILDILASTDGKLNQTLYTQPSILVTSIALLEFLRTKMTIPIDFASGFSLGESTALYAAGVYDYKTILTLIKTRAEGMHAAAGATAGSMSAIIGLELEALTALCKQVSTPQAWVIPANINCPGQIVVSGHTAAVKKLNELATAQGAKRAILLNVSGAFHTPMMTSAIAKLETTLKSVKSNPTKVRLYMNATARPLEAAQLIPTMLQQIVSPVLFHQTVLNMHKDGATAYLEIGPGTTLAGFVKKILPEAPVISFNESSDIANVKGWLQTHGFVK